MALGGWKAGNWIDRGWARGRFRGRGKRDIHVFVGVVCIYMTVYVCIGIWRLDSHFTPTLQCAIPCLAALRIRHLANSHRTNPEHHIVSLVSPRALVAYCMLD